ncbi:MAG: D-sedoheptulose 7-phosphate isomerase [Bacteroidetes bacterium]|nr:D-sedoheptulose 7-phosphate isomerase [Bacteroidota bacterium]MBI3483079.1 D-sedoheptulose 7-phosphate isomerase [Bacteroidota bacterium]
MEFKEIIKAEFTQAAQVLDKFMSNEHNIALVERAAKIIAESIIQGGKVISCGNGGSHCDAMHFAEELTGKYRENRKAIPAICVSDPSHISCVGNDYGYEFIFSRYIDALGNKGDILLGLSTSGNSMNIIRAAESAKEKGMKVIILSGKDGGKLAPLADVELRVSHHGYADRIQEVHIKIIHILMLLIEKQVVTN